MVLPRSAGASGLGAFGFITANSIFDMLISRYETKCVGPWRVCAVGQHHKTIKEMSLLEINEISSPSSLSRLTNVLPPILEPTKYSINRRVHKLYASQLACVLHCKAVGFSGLPTWRMITRASSKLLHHVSLQMDRVWGKSQNFYSLGAGIFKED